MRRDGRRDERNHRARQNQHQRRYTLAVRICLFMSVISASLLSNIRSSKHIINNASNDVAGNRGTSEFEKEINMMLQTCYDAEKLCCQNKNSCDLSGNSASNGRTMFGACENGKHVPMQGASTSASLEEKKQRTLCHKIKQSAASGGGDFNVGFLASEQGTSEEYQKTLTEFRQDTTPNNAM